MDEKWEYLSFEVSGAKVVSIQGLTGTPDDILSAASFGGRILESSAFDAMNFAGKEGWELVSVLPQDGHPSKYGVYYFKRLIA